MKSITVFTPAYNRAHTLRRAFESLKKQTCKDFEWLIIDDGSSDGTIELIEELKEEADSTCVKGGYKKYVCSISYANAICQKMMSKYFYISTTGFYIFIHKQVV